MDDILTDLDRAKAMAVIVSTAALIVLVFGALLLSRSIFGSFRKTTGKRAKHRNK